MSGSNQCPAGDWKQAALTSPLDRMDRRAQAGDWKRAVCCSNQSFGPDVAELNHGQRLEVSCTGQSKDGVGSELHLCLALTRLKIGFSPDWEKQNSYFSRRFIFKR